MSDEVDTLWKLSSAETVVCDNCGHSNPRTNEICEECETPLLMDDDEEGGLNLMVGDAQAALKKTRKVMLEDARNLRNLRRACEGIQSGAMTVDEYRQIVKKLHSMTQMGVNLFKSDVVKKKIEKLADDEKVLVEETRVEIERYHEGVSKMLKFIDTGNINLLTEGFSIAEDSLKKMDKIQDRAIEMEAAS